jgi:alkaline phosphatase D
MITRRQLVAAVPLLGFPAIVRANTWTAGTPFTLGVAAGDPAPDGFVIWTRLAPQPFEPHGGMYPEIRTVGWQVAADEGFRTIVAGGDAVALPDLGHCVHVEVSGLEPDRPYWYRFTAGAERSLTGRARTLPAPGASPAALRFGVCGCQYYEDGLFTAYRHLAREDLAFVFHYGDFIYELHKDFAYDRDGLPAAKVREHRLGAVHSLDDFRAHYAQYLLDPDLQAARVSHAFLSTFDDHEIENNWVGNISQDKAVPPEVFALRRQAAMQAWYEHMPVRKALIPRGLETIANRRFAYGSLAALNVLDTRSFRTDQPCNDWFRPICPGVTAPDAQVLGAAQEEWLGENLGQRDAVWNCVAQQIVAMPIDYRAAGTAEPTFNMDSWAGYAAPRERLLRQLGRAGNAVVLTGDIHQHIAGLLDDGYRAVAAEFVTSSIASGGDGQDQLPRTVERLANNPMVKFVNDQRGYSVHEVTADAWQAHFMVLDRVSTPGGMLSRRATATVPHGSAEMAIS